jgi:prefoldin beta subunit
LAEQELPPWLREQLARYTQLQQNLQAVILQKQQVDMEHAEVERALEQLKMVADEEPVYKSVGPIMVKVRKEDIVKELEEKKELAQTRSMILAKQETKIRESLRELEAKLQEALRGRPAAQPS